MSIYTGVEGVVRTVSKVPITVGGVVKEAKKGVCGVDGVVRQFYESSLVIFDNGVNPYNIHTSTGTDSSLARVGDSLKTVPGTFYNVKGILPFWSDEITDITSIDDYNYLKIVGTGTNFVNIWMYCLFLYFGSSTNYVVFNFRGQEYTESDGIYTIYSSITDTQKNNFKKYLKLNGNPYIKIRLYQSASYSSEEFSSGRYTNAEIYHLSLVENKD